MANAELRRRAALLVHAPGAADDPPVSETVAALEDIGVRVVARLPADATDHDAERAHRATVADVVVGIGGDGTVSRAASLAVLLGLPLCVVRTGTANLFAAALDIPDDIPAAVAAIRNGVATDVAVNRVGERLSISHVSIGFYAAAAATVPPGVKRVSGMLAYWVGLLRVLRGRPRWTATVTIDDVVIHDGDVGLVLCANVGEAAPGGRTWCVASPLEGTAQVVICPPIGVLRLPLLLRDLRDGGERLLRRHVVTEAATIRARDVNTARIDGEVVPVSGDLVVRRLTAELEVLLPATDVSAARVADRRSSRPDHHAIRLEEAPPT